MKKSHISYDCIFQKISFVFFTCDREKDSDHALLFYINVLLFF